MAIETLGKQYYEELLSNFVPYWKGKIDTEYGGVFTCIDNDGRVVLNTKKYIWSQGRFLWIMCKLKELKEFKNDNELEEHIDRTYQFLKKNALLENNHVVSALNRDGSLIPGELDNSIFADCFYILGINAYAFLYKDKAVFDHATQIYQKVCKRFESNEFMSEPYPIPKNYFSHSLPMILLNVSSELYETSQLVNHKLTESLRKDKKLYINRILKLVKESLIVELQSTDDSETLLSRHRNPGHAIESAWFIIHALEDEELTEYIEQIEQLVESSILLGWDEKYGGLFRFVDMEGGEPKGRIINEKMEGQILSTWDSKLWWPHSEALYTILLLYKLTKDEKWMKYYRKIEEYTFSTFPNRELGEWIQIRERDGKPKDEVVALPVKDPFHIMRAFLLIIELSERELSSENR